MPNFSDTPALIHALSSGFGLGLSLILAIGAQNAFVLKQGLKRTHVFWICFTCALSDALLICAGVAGFGRLLERWPEIETIARIGGAIFLAIYGLQNLYSALTQKESLTAQQNQEQSLLQCLVLTLGFTWLNPHVYLDTVVLLGSISSQYQPYNNYFGLGAVIASFTFFFSLGYGARLLEPWFAKARAWQILHALIGVFMMSLAYALIA